MPRQRQVRWERRARRGLLPELQARLAWQAPPPRQVVRVRRVLREWPVQVRQVRQVLQERRQVLQERRALPLVRPVQERRALQRQVPSVRRVLLPAQQAPELPLAQQVPSELRVRLALLAPPAQVLTRPLEALQWAVLRRQLLQVGSQWERQPRTQAVIRR